MARTIRVKVTNDEIEAGRRGEQSSCPIALAIKGMLLGSQAMVDGDSVWVGNSEDVRGMYGELPEVAQDFILEFDMGEMPAPLEFDLVLR